MGAATGDEEAGGAGRRRRLGGAGRRLGGTGRRRRQCRRYALEAIINVIDYLPVHNYVYVPCYNCCGSRARISIKALGRTHMHVWNNKR